MGHTSEGDKVGVRVGLEGDKVVLEGDKVGVRGGQGGG